MSPEVDRARGDELLAAGRLLHDFNVEFGEPTPPPGALANRLSELVESGETVVLLVGQPPDGVAVLRFRPAIWSRGLECYLAELYVVPDMRGRGLGRTLMEEALRVAREQGADRMEIGVDEPDHVARGLYESLGFTNSTDGGLMYVYERDL